MGQNVVQRSFHAGELAPALHLRADQAKYQAGLRTCRNFLIQRQGGAANRGGWRFCAACKTASATVGLIPYLTPDPADSLLLEQGVGYIRVYKGGAPLVVNLGDVDAWDSATAYVIGDLVQNGGVVYYAVTAGTNHAPPNATYWHAWSGTTYEIGTPFTHVMRWHQSGNVITLTHRLEPPHELVYFGDASWVLQPVTTVPTIAAPTGLGVTPGGAGTRTYGYVVTAISEAGEESEASSQIILGSMAEATPDAPNIVEWDAVADAVEYHVYADPFGNGVYGFIGTAAGVTLNDTGITPDFAVAPPVLQELFADPGTYPHVSTTYQQRRVFAQTVDEPDVVIASRTGLPRNFSISSPLQDDDAVEFRLAGASQHRINALTPLKSLIVLTGNGEWVIGSPREPLTPSNIPADQEGYLGAADIPPAVIGNGILYVQERGQIVSELRFDQQVEGLGGRDLTVWGAHLFEDATIVEIAYQQNPHSIIWCARSDGTLLGLTYLREEEVWGWHRHDTGASGHVEHLCVVPETDEDALYAVIRRTIGGATVRYLERLERRQFGTAAFYVDSGLTYDGVAVSTIGGLSHLEGQSVLALADGVPLGPFTVSGGQVALGLSASVVHVGLAITADLETLDVDVSGADVRARKKRVGSLTLQLLRSDRLFQAGPDSSTLTRNTLGDWETASADYTGQDALSLTAEYGDYGRVFLRHDRPLPLAVLGVVPNVEVGG
jgi:hypothetical protein